MRWPFRPYALLVRVCAVGMRAVGLRVRRRQCAGDARLQGFELRIDRIARLELADLILQRALAEIVSFDLALEIVHLALVLLEAVHRIVDVRIGELAANAEPRASR